MKTFKLELLAPGLICIEINESEKKEADNSRQADLIVERILKIVDQSPNTSFKFLADLTKLGNVTYMSNHAREVYIKLQSHDMLLKVAVVGNNLLLEVSVNLLLEASGRGHSFKWFKDIDSAKKWLALS